MERPIEIRFKSLYKDKEYFTLDGVQKLECNEYIRHIFNFSELLQEEQDYILLRYKSMEKVIDKLKDTIAEFKENPFYKYL